MEKNRTFNYIFSRILLGFVALTGIINNAQASFFHATTLKNTDKKQNIHFIYDQHVQEPDMNQAEAMVEEIAQDPDNSLAIVEIHNTWATAEMAAATKNHPRGLFCHVSAALAQRNVPTLNIEFRTYLTDDGKTPCILSAPEDMSAAEFTKIIKEQLALIQESQDQLLTKEDIAFWDKVLEICSREEFKNSSLLEVYDYLQKNNENDYPTPEEIFDKTHTLIDAKIIRYVTESDKANIFVIAGGGHLTRVRAYLEEHGYSTVHEQGISTQEAIDLYQKNQEQPEKLAHALPHIDMHEYFKMAHNTEIQNKIAGCMVWQPFIVT